MSISPHVVRRVTRTAKGANKMGKVVVTEFVTLDGVIESPGGGEGFAHDGWSFKFNRGDEADKFKSDELMPADAQLLARSTYQIFARAWPPMRDIESSYAMT